jgi:hypothetical protein
MERPLGGHRARRAGGGTVTDVQLDNEVRSGWRIENQHGTGKALGKARVTSAHRRWLARVRGRIQAARPPFANRAEKNVVERGRGKGGAAKGGQGGGSMAGRGEGNGGAQFGGGGEEGRRVE